jgi:hypothetical protein
MGLLLLSLLWVLLVIESDGTIIRLVRFHSATSSDSQRQRQQEQPHSTSFFLPVALLLQIHPPTRSLLLNIPNSLLDCLVDASRCPHPGPPACLCEACLTTRTQRRLPFVFSCDQVLLSSLSQAFLPFSSASSRLSRSRWLPIPSTAPRQSPPIGDGRMCDRRARLDDATVFDRDGSGSGVRKPRRKALTADGAMLLGVCLNMVTR